MTDDQATANFSANVMRWLRENDKTIYWLMVETGFNENRLYPAVKGKSKPSVGMVTTVAAVTGMTCDQLLDFDLNREQNKKKKTSKNLQHVA